MKNEDYLYLLQSDVYVPRKPCFTFVRIFFITCRKYEYSIYGDT